MGVELTGQAFNDAYRYVDWLLTVPLLLIELILVMGLSSEETTSLSWSLGMCSALMVALGYPGEIQDKPEGRWTWWALAMIPFCYVVYTLAVGLEAATSKMHPDAAYLTRYARWLTIISWLTYPGVYIIKMVGLSGVTDCCGADRLLDRGRRGEGRVRCADLVHRFDQVAARGRGRTDGVDRVDIGFRYVSASMLRRRDVGVLFRNDFSTSVFDWKRSNAFTAHAHMSSNASRGTILVFSTSHMDGGGRRSMW